MIASAPNAALLGNDLIDGVAESYVQQQIDFLVATGHVREGSRGEDFAYAAKEADAIRQRALAHLPQASPLRRLAMLPWPEPHRSQSSINPAGHFVKYTVSQALELPLVRRFEVDSRSFISTPYRSSMRW